MQALALIGVLLLVTVVLAVVLNRLFTSGNPATDGDMGLVRDPAETGLASGVREELSASRWDFEAGDRIAEAAARPGAAAQPGAAPATPPTPPTDDSQRPTQA